MRIAVRCQFFAFVALLFLIRIGGGEVQAQQIKSFLYHKDNGLPSDAIRALNMDTLGVLWLGTDNGLVKYDGNQFKVFENTLAKDYIKDIITTQKGDLLVLADNSLFKVNDTSAGTTFESMMYGERVVTDTTLYYGKELYEDRKGNIWVADEYRIFKYSVETGKSEVYPMSEERNKAQDTMESFSFGESADGTLYAFNYNGFLYRFNGMLFLEIDLPEWILPKGITFVQHYRNNSFIVSSKDKGLGLLTINKNNKVTWKTIDRDVVASDILKKEEGHYLVASESSKSIYELKKSGKSLRLTRHPDLGVHGANVILQTAQDTWLGTNLGLRQMKELPFYTLGVDLENPYIQHTVHYKDHLYLTDGMSVYKGKLGDNQSFELEEKFSDNDGNSFLRILPDGDGIWTASTQGHLMYWKDKERQKMIDRSDFGAMYVLEKDPRSNYLWVRQDGAFGPIRINASNGEAKVYGKDDGINGRIVMLKHTKSGKLYAGGGKVTDYLYVYLPERDSFKNLSIDPGLGENAINFSVNDILELSDGSLLLGTTLGVFRRSKEGGIERIDIGAYTATSVRALSYDEQRGYVWVANAKGVLRLNLKTDEFILFAENDGMETPIVNYRCLETGPDGNVYAGTPDGLMVGTNLINLRRTTTPIISKVSLQGEKLLPTEISSIPLGRYFQVYYSVPEYPSKMAEVEYRLVGKHENWKPVQNTETHTIEISADVSGAYTLQVRARAAGSNRWSVPAQYTFKVQRQWYETYWALGLYVFGGLLALILVVRLNVYRVKKDKERLEQQVKERTQEADVRSKELVEKNKELNSAFNRLKRSEAILNNNAQELEKAKKEAERNAEKLKEQNEKMEEYFAMVREQNLELMDHRDQIIKQTQELNEKSHLLEKQHENMMSSVNYAKRIQNALLGSSEDVETKISNIGENWDSFILFKPRDVVSGDFYWYTQKAGKTIIVAADCTGHGIPGAFMSLIGNDMLHQVIHERNITEPSLVLKTMHRLIQTALHQRDYKESRDGMDISICVINPYLNTLSFAGAGNPLYYIEKENPQEVKVIKGQRYGVGGKDYKDRVREYQTEVLRLEDIQAFYIFSDGYQDQFGGPEGRKILSKNFRKQIFSIADLPMEMQKQCLEDFYNDWTAEGHFKQIDDILIIGVKTAEFEYAKPIHGEEELDAEALEKELIM
ncbi:SpoIIE family protein phosphatase [Algivirga pacifica]|uniref:PPM-type phosphatase domain-containing protein n=1 Tax=Algivirga pacifica TaxID=1162670 RepID=A0ABP9DG65_9BACT